MLRTSIQHALAGLACAGVLALNVTTAAAADPTEAGTGDNACVFFRTVYDWKVLDDSHLVIFAPSRNDPYEVELAMPLRGIKFADRLAFVDRNLDGRLCGYGGDKVVLPDEPIHTESFIAGMRELDAQSLAALADQYDMKLPKRYLRAEAQSPEAGPG